MKRVIFTSDAPTPIGPYSQAIHAGNTLYISGQIALIPATGELVTSNIEEETHQVLRNIGAILKAANLEYESVVSSIVYIKDMDLFSRINAVYATYFTGDAPPARALVQVSDLPKHVNIEISATAIFA